MPRSLLALLAALAAGPAAAADFDADVAPILSARCLPCHSGDGPKGKLDLSRKSPAAAVVTPGKPDDSPLWVRVRDDEMPPKHPLPAAEKAVLKAWVAAGAKWGTDPIDPFALTSSVRAGRDWWSLKPVKRPAVPTLPADASKGWAANPVDAFILAKLRAKGLTPSPPADPRTLVRRLHFDLTGLPPTVEEVEAFAKDSSDAAYRKLVDRLLASPEHGERWARHWLDVVRYGESDGFERNAPRPTAWPYRDWVIRAITDDLPFDEFARLQIAGDVLRPGDADAVKATGFLVAGIHNTVLGANAAARETARQDELEDVIGTTAQAFLGLTVQCARCHDHKFDPIPQTDYYRVAAALGGVFHGEGPLPSPAVAKAREEDLHAALAAAEKEMAALEAAGRDRVRAKRGDAPDAPAVVAPLHRWTFEGGNLPATLVGGAKVAGGRLVLDGKAAFAVSAPLTTDVRAKTLEAWVTLPTLNQGGGGVISIETETGAVFDAIVFAERKPRQWMAGSDHYRRTRDPDGPDETAEPGQLVHVAVTYEASGRIQVYRDGAPYGKAYTPAGETPTFKAGTARVLFGKRHTGGGRSFFLGEIAEARLYDRALTADEVAASAKAGPGAKGVSRADTLAALTADETARLDRLTVERKKLAGQVAALAAAEKVFAVTPKQPPATHVLARGNVEKRLAVVAPGGAAGLPGADFGLKPDAAEAERRAAFARWVTRPDNPLFARVAVNRVWHHHFGIGIVETPSDLGFNGGRPTHPELLDWLAAEFVEHRYSARHVHRLIVTSAAYRQASAPTAAGKATDADNRLLWRRTPVRLEAEAVRDAILSVSGQLNPQRGGPSFHDVRTYHNSGTTYYEPTDPVGPEFDRRTVYRFSPRGERSAMLDTFDCPDPSAATPRRPVTTTPLQALALWNGSFVLRAADRFADRVKTDTGNDVPAQVRRAYRLALARDPLPAEAGPAAELVTKHGVPALVRVLFNCNEFVVIE